MKIVLRGWSQEPDCTRNAAESLGHFGGTFGLFLELSPPIKTKSRQIVGPQSIYT